MSNGVITLGPVLGIVLALLALAAAAVVRLGGLDSPWPMLVAAVRAAVQLAAVSLVIAAVLRSAWLTAVFVLLMYAVAAFTSAGRLGSRRAVTVTAAPIACGVAPVLAALLGSGLVPARPIAVLPIAGILVGAGMTATTLAGRRARDELSARRGEYEAALALGFLPRAAALEVILPTAGQALVPALDQTRTVGLVTLPGAFVGVLLGGASPVQAGITQLVVLIGILAVQSVAVLVTVELMARRPPQDQPRAQAAVMKALRRSRPSTIRSRDR